MTVTTRSGQVVGPREQIDEPDTPNMALPTGIVPTGNRQSMVTAVEGTPSPAPDDDDNSESESGSEDDDDTELIALLVQAIRGRRSRRGRMPSRINISTPEQDSPMRPPRLPAGENRSGRRGVPPPQFPSFPMGPTHPLLKLPTLQSTSGLEGHLCRIRNILSEFQLLSIEGTIIRGFYDSIMSLVLESLVGVKAIHTEAEYLIENRVQFREMMESLLSHFCDRRAVAELIRTEMDSLKLERPYIRYVHGLRRVYRLHKRVFSREDHVSRLIDHILLTVPIQVSNKIVKEMQAIDPVQWTTAIPFDIDRESTSETRSVLSLLQNALAAHEASEDVAARIKQLRSLASSATPKPIDRAQLADLPAPTETPSAPPPTNGPWLEDWVKRFKHVYKVTGNNCFTELRKFSSGLDPTLGEVKVIRSKNYGFIGLHSATKPNLDCSVTPFELKPSKN